MAEAEIGNESKRQQLPAAEQGSGISGHQDTNDADSHPIVLLAQLGMSSSERGRVETNEAKLRSTARRFSTQEAQAMINPPLAHELLAAFPGAPAGTNVKVNNILDFRWTPLRT
ncbi:hypothetical protein EMCG_03851 [[Emmonsia] crescens]|uniref:Uncharacterized protein n=1 Tax=[Emmonsia] crescens TaxID=73230 RepID=A0A0G2HV11_9EURO|nr:hypothetical protein EMCG_03851 [Emmonsia crescens UAMH 3008]